MKTLLYFLITCVSFHLCNAQIGDTRADNDIVFNDLTTKYFKDKRYANVEGNPFLLDDWSPGKLVMKSSIKYEGLKVRMDLLKQEVVVLESSNKEMVAPIAFIRQLELTNGENKLIFRTGYPKIEKKTVNTLYGVLIEGKVSLLKFSQKDIVQKDEFDKRKSFILYEDYYVFFNETITLVRNKNTFLKLFPDQSGKIDTYISDNKIKTRDEKDLISLVTFLNSSL